MDWDALLARLLHPTQVEILEAMAWIGEPLSPTGLVRVLGWEAPPLGQVSYHARRLRDLGALEPAGARRVRGAVEHFYVVAGPPA